MLLALPPHPALPLVREDFFDGDDYVVAMDWVDGTDLATLLRRARAPRARAVERARLPRPGRRGAHAPALAVAAGHPRRRQARQPDPHQGRPDQARRLRPLLGARRAAAARGHARATARPSWPPAARPSRASDVYALAATAFALLTGSAPAGRAARRGRASTRRRPSSSRPRSGSGMATDPARRPADARRARRAPAGRLGGRRCRPASSRSASRTSRARPRCGRRTRRRWPRRSCATTS